MRDSALNVNINPVPTLSGSIMFSGIASWWSSSESPPVETSAKYDPTNPRMNPLNPKGLKPCCACPETKSARDSCFLQHGADNGQCAELIKRHVECMRGLGFEIQPASHLSD